MASLVSHKCPDEVALAALEFLASLGNVFFSQDSQVQWTESIRPFVIVLHLTVTLL